MFTYVQVSKNTYPYRTLHLSTCGVLNRVSSYRSRTLDHREVASLDGVRTDMCSRCMPTRTAKNLAGYTETVYHAGQTNFWAVQRAFKDDEAAQWAKVHAVRKLVALEIAVEAAKLDVDLTDVRTADLYAEYSRTGREGSYMLPEVTLSRR